ITSADLARLRPLTDVAGLTLHSMPGVNDTGLEHLQPLTKLRDLRIVSCQVTNAGVKHLQGFARLETLFLTDTQVTDDGLKLLPPLKYGGGGFLALDQTSTGDKILEYLKTLFRLDQFSPGKKFTDDGLRQLKAVRPELKTLELLGTKVTGAGLAGLKGL